MISIPIFLRFKGREVAFIIIAVKDTDHNSIKNKESFLL